MTVGVSDEVWAGIDPAQFRLTPRERLRVFAAGILVALIVAVMIVGRATGFTSLKLDVTPHVLTPHPTTHTITVSYQVANSGSTADRIVAVTPNVPALTTAPGTGIPVTVEGHSKAIVVVQLAVDCRAGRTSPFELRFDVERGPWTLSTSDGWDVVLSSVREVCRRG